MEHNNATPSRSLRPIKRACADCHARKVKCDGAVNGYPCSNCRSVNIECAVIARQKRIRRPARNSNTVFQQPTQIVNNSTAEQLPSPNNNGPETIETAPTLPTARQDGEDENEPQSGVVDEVELARQHLVNFFGQNLQEAPIRTRLAYVGSELANLNYLVRQRAANRNVYHYPCSNIYIPRVQWNSHAPGAPSLIPKDAFIVPPKHISDVLITAYFEDVHPCFPIVDKDSFLRLYNGQQSGLSLLLLQAICLAGSHVTAAFKNNQDFKVSFFRRAKALFDGRYEEDRMEMVQAALLLTWFSDGGDDICANAWWWIGVASRTAIGLGMHREVGPSKMSETDKRTWKRMWWCLVQFDCLVSLCYGRPQNIDLDDCDVPVLTPDDFDASTGIKEMNFVINHSRLCALISQLVRSHFSLRAIKSETSRRARIDAVDASLAEWLSSLPLDFRQDAAVRPTEEPNPWPLLLHLTYNTVLVLIHRSSASSGASDDIVDDEICLEATSNIIHIFEHLTHQSSLRLCCFWAPTPPFTALLHLRGQLRSKNPILALRANEKYQSGMQSLRKLSRYWLFASSVWRLFESISTKEPRQNQSVNATVAQVPHGTMISMGSSLNPYHEAPGMKASDEPQSRETEWTQLIAGEEPGNARYVPMEQNRWQDHLQEWQSIYWSDPLASIRLQENFVEYT